MSLSFVVAVGWIVSTADGAAAHGGASGAAMSSNYRTRITSTLPESAGFTVRVIDTGSRLELTNRRDEVVVVAGYQGEPYLRVGPDGLFENQRSPATYLNRARDAQVEVPDIADPAATPEWRRVSTSATARWHDHRSHWMSSEPPPAVQRDRDTEFVIFDRWVVPVSAGGEAFEIVGDLTWVLPPNRVQWWLITLALGAASVGTFVRYRSGWIRAVALGAATVVDLAATIGVVKASVGSVFVRSSQFLYAVLLGIVAVRAMVQASRHAPGPFLAAGVGGFLSFGVSGASRLDGYSNSQIPSTIYGTIDRSLTAVSLAVGTALLIDFVLQLRQKRRRVAP